jgi:hypothetical protein
MNSSDDDFKTPGRCEQVETLATPFEPDTVVFGTMFTVESKSAPIIILTMDFTANCPRYLYKNLHINIEHPICQKIRSKTHSNVNKQRT